MIRNNTTILADGTEIVAEIQDWIALPIALFFIVAAGITMTKKLAAGFGVLAVGAIITMFVNDPDVLQTIGDGFKGAFD